MINNGTSDQVQSASPTTVVTACPPWCNNHGRADDGSGDWHSRSVAWGHVADTAPSDYIYWVHLDSDTDPGAPVTLWVELFVRTLTPDHAENLGRALIEQAKIAREHGSWVTKMRGETYWDGERYVSDDVDG